MGPADQPLGSAGDWTGRTGSNAQRSPGREATAGSVVGGGVVGGTPLVVPGAGPPHQWARADPKANRTGRPIKPAPPRMARRRRALGGGPRGGGEAVVPAT